MIVPNIVRHGCPITAEAQAAFDGLFFKAVSETNEHPVAYTLPYPKIAFFDHLSERYGCVFHGSNCDRLTALRPIPDKGARFRRQELVFASPDGVWAMWYAVMDRAITGGATFDAGMRLTFLRRKSIRLYFFALHRQALAGGYPFATGTVYILRGEDFPVRDTHFDGRLISYALEQWASRQVVHPLAAIKVHPHDFPYLCQVQAFRRPRIFP